jgi:hypothetical protein
VGGVAARRLLPRTVLLGVLSLFVAGSAHAQRSAVVGRDPIPLEVENAYLKGLKYLVSQQKADGSWGDQYGQEPGVVGLAVMAMLAHGDDPNVGPYKDAIRKGIRYILTKADAKTGQIGSQQYMTMYSHGFATLALAEAYGVVDEPLIGPTLQRAVDFLVACQKRNPLGAWRYSADAKDADTTVSGAQMVGLFAARNAGINVPDEAIEKGLKYYRTCQDGSGGIGYSGRDGPNTTRTGIGLLVFTLARQKDSPFYKSAAGYFKQNIAGMSSHPFYHEYYASQAAFHLDEVTWQAWNSANITRMIRMQDPSSGGWGSGGFGGCYSTASALLSLALNYRYLPIYER